MGCERTDCLFRLGLGGEVGDGYIRSALREGKSDGAVTALAWCLERWEEAAGELPEEKVLA